LCEWLFLTSISKLAGFLISLLCFLVMLELVEGKAFVVVGDGRVGVKADGLLIGG